jgi:hypothetical protein
VPAHTELMWILSTVASMGYLSRMTQWKVRIILPHRRELFSWWAWAWAWLTNLCRASSNFPRTQASMTRRPAHNYVSAFSHTRSSKPRTSSYTGIETRPLCFYPLTNNPPEPRTSQSAKTKDNTLNSPDTQQTASTTYTETFSPSQRHTSVSSSLFSLIPPAPQA